MVQSLYHIYQRDSDSCWAEVDTFLGTGFFLSAVTVLVAVILHIGTTYPDACLNAPVWGKYPVVTVGYATACQPTIMVVVAYLMEDTEGIADTTHIEAATQQVDAQEVARKRVTKPTAQFGLKKPVLTVVGVARLEGLAVGREIQSPTGGQ